jgi:hypothetical protein
MNRQAALSRSAAGKAIKNIFSQRLMALTLMIHRAPDEAYHPSLAPVAAANALLRLPIPGEPA